MGQLLPLALDRQHVLQLMHRCSDHMHLYAGGRVLQLVRRMLSRHKDVGAVLNLGAELLRPESSCQVDVRLEALTSEHTTSGCWVITQALAI